MYSLIYFISELVDIGFKSILVIFMYIYIKRLKQKGEGIMKYSIKVNLTEQDLYQLQGGEGVGLYFDWSFPTEEDKNVIINVKVTTGEDEEE